MSLLRNTALRVAALIVAAFVVATLFIPYETLGGTILLIRAALALVLAIICVPVAIEALRTRPLRPHHFMGLGMFVAWLAIAAGTAWAVVGLLFGFSTSIRDSTVTTFLALMSVVGLILHIIGPTFTPPATRLQNWWPIIVAALVGVFLAGLLIGAGVRS